MSKTLKGFTVFVNEIIDQKGISHTKLENAGCEVILGKPMGQFPGYSEAEMVQRAQKVDVLMGGMRDPYTRKVIESSEKLQLIAKYGRGVEKIDLEAASEFGILVCNAPVAGNVQAVAEHTIALILSLMKRLKKVETHFRSGGWRDFTVEGLDMSEKTLGFIGFGKIGQAVAERFQPWGMKFLFFDPYLDSDTIKEVQIEKESIDEVLKKSDIVTIHAVATPENYHLINREKLRLMKNTAYLINTSRRELIDESALADALAQNQIAGVGLDVFETEPPDQDHPLKAFAENAILTPHTAGWTPGSKQNIAETCVKNILAVLQGEIPPFLVNKEALSIWEQRFRR